MIRKTSVAGSFYPSDATEIEKYFNHFSQVYKQHISLPNFVPKAVIVPHAGYVYSGFTANMAYQMLQKSGIKNFAVIGPSHRVAFSGMSLCDFEGYETPFGILPGDQATVREIRELFSLECLEEVHAEHSTEVQFPFIKYYIPDAKIIEIVYGDTKPKSISKVIEYICEKKEWGVVISTDLSHFYTQEEARIFDAVCLEAVEKLDPFILHRGCEACGKTGVEAMLEAAKKLQLRSEIFDYRTSADASGDTSRVVGYMSAVFV